MAHQSVWDNDRILDVAESLGMPGESTTTSCVTGRCSKLTGPPMTWH